MASRQKGIVTYAQLRAAGLSPGKIKRSVRIGAFHRLYLGVYAVGHTALAPWARELAALLACGKGAIISHWSAALLWGLIDRAPAQVDVTLTSRRCRHKAGIALHQALGLDKRDLRVRHNVPVTSPARTLIDLAAVTGTDELERLVAEARIKRLIRPAELEKALERHRGRNGAGRMRDLRRAEGRPGITRSKAERILRRMLGRADLPQPRTNVRLRSAGRTYETDFLWPSEKVVVEVDSWGFHGHRAAFERDRRKTMALQAAGYHVIRITAVQLELEPLLVIAQIARALDRAARAPG